MRYVDVRRIVLATGPALVAVATAAGEASAAADQLFPVKQHLVPVVVAATFILPAAIAGIMSMLRRLGVARLTAVAVGLLAVGGLAMMLSGPGLGPLRM
ncbi:MAG: hypothetical protein AB7O57_12245 [Hyphomicrobiaceae bacterium]